MMTRLFVVAMALAFSVPARAEWLLASNIEGSPGCSKGLVLVYMNLGDKPVSVLPPDKLRLKLHIGPRQQDKDAKKVTVCPGNAEGPVAPGQFRRWHVELELSTDINGPVMVEYVPEAKDGETPVPARTILLVQRAEEPVFRDGRRNRSYGDVQILPTASNRMPAIDPFAIEDDPMYFLAGGSGGLTAKFQVSLKYALRRQWNLFIGYSQLSIWDLSSDSKPFRDNNYRPSLFWYEPRLYFPSSDTRVGLRAGIEHESNGRSGLDSRSINIVFLRPELRKDLNSKYFVEFKPKLYNYFDKDENTDIGRYRGYADWTLRFGSHNWLLGTTVRRGQSGGSHQFDYTRRIDGRWSHHPDSGLFFHLQFFSGEGETLLDFNTRRSTQVRAGIGIVR